MIWQSKKQKNPSKIFMLFLSILLATSIFPAFGGSVAEADAAIYYVSSSGDDDNGDGTEGNPFGTISKAFDKIASAGTIVLLSDMTLTTELTLNDGKEIMIRSNVETDKKSIIRAASYDGQLIEVSGGAEVTFKDLVIDGNDVAANDMGVYATGGTAIFEGVVLEKHHIAANYGTAVIFAYGSGKALIKDGTVIRNNRLSGISTPDGSGNYNPSAILSAGSGGHLTIEGGLITDNTVEAGSNAVIVAIGLSSHPVFTMTGGAITNNRLFGDGEDEVGATVGNVAVNMRGSATQARFEFGGTAYVYGNTNAVGEQRNVFLKNTEATDSAYLSLIGPMVEGAKVGVYANIMPTSDDPIVDVAIGHGDYEATVSDAVYFVSDKASQAEIQYNDDDGQKVILAPIPPVLDHVWLNQASVDGKEITLVFNDDIQLTDLNGFVITVGESSASIDSFQVNGNELVIFLAETPTDDIALDYTAEDGNLAGLNGMPVENFRFHYAINFAGNFTVTSPTGDPAEVMNPRPQIEGIVDSGSTVDVVVKNADSMVVDGAGGSATVDGGNWTFSPYADLEEGTYTFEITATNSNGTMVVTKTKTLIIDEKLKLVKVTVDDATPDQATLSFNLPVKEGLTDADFASFEIDGRTVTSVKQIDGNEVIVELSEPFAPGDALTVVYDETADGSGIVSAGEEGMELSTIPADSTEAQAAIDKANNVIPLAIVAAYVEDGKLKLVFNKNVEEESLDLSGLTYGGVSVQEPFEVIGNEIIIPLPEGSTSHVLAYDANLDGSNVQEANNANNRLGDLTPGIELGEDQFYLDDAGKLTAGLGFVDDDRDIPLTPVFDVDQPSGYQAAVANKVSSIGLSPVPTLPAGSALMVKVNGTEITDYDNLPLLEGANAITVGVYDVNNPHVWLGQYDFTVIRASGSNDDSGSSGGGGSSGSGTNTKTIEVDVVIGGDNAADITRIPIVRTTHEDGTITDQVEFTVDKARETVEKAIETGENLARAVIPDPEDQVSEVNVDIPVETAKLLLDNGIDLEIYTDNATVRIPNASLDEIEEDFYFRLVPVKDEKERNEVEERATVESVVREVAGNNHVEVVARPMTIETNLSDRPVTLILPLRDVELPENEAAREAYLSQLGIFIEHSDGEKEVVKGKPVTYSEGLWGLEFSISKFSTFTIIRFNTQDAGVHTPYITGFPDGEFKPDANVTRAQIALMVARNLGYEVKETSESVPFKDIPSDHYAAGAIAFVKASGIMNGDPGGLFRPDETMTRAEMATVVSNYLDLNLIQDSTTTFNDTKGHWAQTMIEANVSSGIIKGYPDGSFKPNQPLSRAEAVVMINQMFDRGPLYGAETSLFPDATTNHWAFKDIQEAALLHDYLIDEEQKEQFAAE